MLTEPHNFIDHLIHELFSYIFLAHEMGHRRVTRQCWCATSTKEMTITTTAATATTTTSIRASTHHCKWFLHARCDLVHLRRGFLLALVPSTTWKSIPKLWQRNIDDNGDDKSLSLKFMKPYIEWRNHLQWWIEEVSPHHHILLDGKMIATGNIFSSQADF